MSPIKIHLAAGLHPNPLGELEYSPDPLAAIWGGALLLREKGGQRRGEEKMEGKGTDSSI